MEGKTMILSVFILSLVMAKIQGEAIICCPNKAARDLYNICRMASGPFDATCLSISGCKFISGTTCPPGFTNDILENSENGVNKYCKLGCISSVCSALTNLQNFDVSEIVNGEIGQCVKACSTLCTKDSMNAVETA